MYEELFMFYHKRPCETCNNIPKDPSLCLICGQIICMREPCCRNGNTFEGVHVCFYLNNLSFKSITNH